jgi:hypothetical protein
MAYAVPMVVLYVDYQVLLASQFNNTTLRSANVLDMSNQA